MNPGLGSQALLTPLASLATLLFGVAIPGQDPADAPPTYHSHVAPILKARCAGCHRPGKSKGKLDMSSYQTLIKGGETGPALIAGDPDKSLLVTMIQGPDPEMPTKGKPLTAEQVASIKRWIKAGAPLGEPVAAEIAVAAPAVSCGASVCVHPPIQGA